MTADSATIAIDDAHLAHLTEFGVRTPAAEQRVRVLFVGQRTYFESSALNLPTAAIEPRFVDFRSGADPAPIVTAVNDFDPQVIVVFRPEIIPAGLFRGIDALTLGFLTEPLPRPSNEDEHPDLRRRLEYLKGIDKTNFDRIVSFDPLVVDSVGEVAEVWRSVPLPVGDEYFLPVERWSEPPRPVFMGRSTRHREAWLIDAKHHHDVLHIAHGVFGEELRELLAKPTLSINIHNEHYPTFEVRVPLCLASGHLVASERLSPLHGLEPDVDHIEMLAAMNLLPLIDQVKADPNVFHQVRVIGRMKAERFRASRVYWRLIGDLYADVAHFGRGPRQV